MRPLRLALVALSFIATTALADGKFYSDRIPPPGIPFQRAIMLWDGELETLIIESKFEAKGAERFGWVVPIPALPEVKSPPVDRMDSWYIGLDTRTRAFVIHRDYLLLACFLFLLVGGIPYQVRTKRWVAASAAAVIAIFLLLFAFRAHQGLDVQVVKEERVGPYETKIVRATSASDLISWMNENGFRFDEGDRAAFDGYVTRGWAFVTAKLDAGVRGAARGVMVPPLQLSFPSAEPLYPLVLTGTAGETIELLLYVYALKRMDAGDRLPVRYAGETDSRIGESRYTYLTKFRGQLSPEQMRTDLVLKPAASNRSSREWQFRW